MKLKQIFSTVTNLFLVIGMILLTLLVTVITEGRTVFIRTVKLMCGVIIGIIILFLIYNFIKNKNEREREEEEENEREKINDILSRVQIKMKDDIEIYQGEVELKIQNIDKNFQKEEFNEFAKMIFSKVQQAFNKRDYKDIRLFESKELFERHKIQIKGYLENKTINVKDIINIFYAKIYKFKQTIDRDILIVILKAELNEYIVDENNKKIVNGSNRKKIQYYKMEFIRKKGVKTLKSANNLKTINCPNCGGPSKIIFAGECPYCGSIIIEGKHSWILNSLELLKEI